MAAAAANRPRAWPTSPSTRAKPRCRPARVGPHHDGCCRRAGISWPIRPQRRPRGPSDPSRRSPKLPLPRPASACAVDRQRRFGPARQIPRGAGGILDGHLGALHVPGLWGIGAGGRKQDVAGARRVRDGKVVVTAFRNRRSAQCLRACCVGRGRRPMTLLRQLQRAECCHRITAPPLLHLIAVRGVGDCGEQGHHGHRDQQFEQGKTASARPWAMGSANTACPDSLGRQRMLVHRSARGEPRHKAIGRAHPQTSHQIHHMMQRPPVGQAQAQGAGGADRALAGTPGQAGAGA